MRNILVFACVVLLNPAYLKASTRKACLQDRSLSREGLSRFMQDLERFGVLEREAPRAKTPMPLEKEDLETWDSKLSAMLSALSSQAGLTAAGHLGFGANYQSSPYGATPEDLRRFEQNRVDASTAFARAKAESEKGFDHDNVKFLQTKPKETSEMSEN